MGRYSSGWAVYTLNGFTLLHYFNMARTRLQKNSMMFENIKNLERGVIAKLFVLYLMASLVTNTESKRSTACHGLDNLGCVLHNLTCDRTSSISINGGQYGFRPGCGKTTNCSISATGLPDCCLASPTSCVRVIDKKTLSNTDRSCSNRSSCTFAVREAPASCKNLTVNAYSLIEYSCIPRIVTTVPPRLPPTTTQSTTTTLSTTELNVIVPSASVPISRSANSDCTRAAVVGGVLGTIICILIALMVLEFVYFYRKLHSMKQGGGHVISHYASTHRTNTIEEEKPAYDDLRPNHGDKAEEEKPAYDDLQTPQPKDDERHYYNLDNARRTTNPIYCNLNNGAYSSIKK